MDKSLDEIISSKPRGIRRGSARRTARAQVLGTAGVSPATRARIAASGAPKVVAAAPAVSQPTDKIIVSNLPTDVNETQLRNCSTQLSALSARSPSIMTVLADQKELPLCISRGKEMAPRPSSNITTGSSMGNVP